MNLFKKILYGNKVDELLSAGIKHLEEENYHSAITFFTHVLDINKKSKIALLNRAEAYINIRDYVNAQNDLVKLEKIDSDFDVKQNLFMSKVHSYLNNNEESAIYAEKYFTINNEKPEAQYFNARQKYLNGEYEEALNLTDILIASEQDDYSINYLRSLIYFAQNNLMSALLSIDKSIEQNSINPFSFNLRGLINVQLLNYQEAVDDFDYALRLEPNNPIYYFNISKIQMKIGDLIAAKSSINNAIELSPGNKSYFLLKAEIERVSENLEESLKCYINASQIDPKDQSIKKIIAGLKIKLNDYSGALEELKSLEEETENDAELLFEIAKLEFNLNHLESAKEYIKSAIEKNPDYTEAILQNGILEYWNKNYKEAQKIFNNLLEKGIKEGKLIYYNIRALIKLGEFEVAEKYLNEIPENERKEDDGVLRAQIMMKKDDFNSGELEIEPQNEKIIKLINSLAKFHKGEIEDAEELNEFEYMGDIKKKAQILNSLISFEKEHYNSANYRINNIADLNDYENNELEPFRKFLQERVS